MTTKSFMTGFWLIRLWTSGISMHGGPWVRKEFCSIINSVIRKDRADAVFHAGPFTRAINKLVVTRGRADCFPAEGVLWRGGTLPSEHRAFFAPGVKYRVPAFMATSVEKDVANRFVLLAEADGGDCVRWRVELDERGETDVSWRCKHAAYVTRSHYGPDEAEFLFPPYSAFEVIAVKWSNQAKDARYPHEITVRFVGPLQIWHFFCVFARMKGNGRKAEFDFDFGKAGLQWITRTSARIYLLHHGPNRLPIVRFLFASFKCLAFLLIRSLNPPLLPHLLVS
jgi:hypothetical protein